MSEYKGASLFLLIPLALWTLQAGAPGCGAAVETVDVGPVCVLLLPPGNCDLSFDELSHACQGAAGAPYSFPALVEEEGGNSTCSCREYPAPLNCEDGNVYRVRCCRLPATDADTDSGTDGN